MQLREAPDDEVARLLVAVHVEGGVLVAEPPEGLVELVLVAVVGGGHGELITAGGSAMGGIAGTGPPVPPARGRCTAP